MISKKAREVKVQRQPSPQFEIHNHSFICVSKETLERLSTYRLRCELCKRWLAALAFYAQVGHTESEGVKDAVYLARYEVKVEGFKGCDTVAVCEDCALGKV